MYGTAEKLKRALAMLLSILMLVTVLPVSALAETGTSAEDPATEATVIEESAEVSADPELEQPSAEEETPEEPEPTATPEPVPTAIPRPDYIFPQAEVKLADILEKLRIDLGVSYELDLVVDNSLLTPSHKVVNELILEQVTLTAKVSFRYTVLTLQRGEVVYTRGKKRNGIAYISVSYAVFFRDKKIPK